MGIYLNPGNELFRTSVSSDIYVDKTELIKHTNKLMGTRQRYVCISRPRRFGKSMAAEMLAAYYGKNCDSEELFSPYKIAQSTDYKKHLNHYNVIALNMQDFLNNADNIDEMIECIQEKLLLELKQVYEDVITNTNLRLRDALATIYTSTQEKFIFIIDEWDCILRENLSATEDYKKYLKFLQDLLKDKAYIALAYMTGILPIKKYGTHSALNMFDEYSMISPKRFTEFIGFTESEVKTLCTQYQMDFDMMKNWYDGYTFKKATHVYNPKSVVDAILAEEYNSYWTQTETYEALKIYIDLNFDELKDSIIQMLAGNHVKIDCETFQNDMTTFHGKDDVLTLLVHLGYLAYDSEQNQVFIPNAEVRAEFVRAVKGCHWQEVITALNNSEQLLQATWDEDNKKVAEMIDNIHMENTSILTYNDENSLSCVISLAYFSAMNEYTQVREFPTGKGFADIVYLPKPHSDKPAMIIELKYDKSAESAITQIKEKHYVKALENYHGNLLLVGINYDKATKKHSCIIEKQYLTLH